MTIWTLALYQSYHTIQPVSVSLPIKQQSQTRGMVILAAPLFLGNGIQWRTRLTSWLTVGNLAFFDRSHSVSNSPFPRSLVSILNEPWPVNASKWEASSDVQLALGNPWPVGTKSSNSEELTVCSLEEFVFFWAEGAHYWANPLSQRVLTWVRPHGRTTKMYLQTNCTGDTNSLLS